MVKVSIEVRDSTAHFMVRVQAQNIEQAVIIVRARYPSSVVKVNFPINPENFFVEDIAA